MPLTRLARPVPPRRLVRPASSMMSLVRIITVVAVTAIVTLVRLHAFSPHPSLRASGFTSVAAPVPVERNAYSEVPSALDRKIVERAAALIPSPERWNRDETFSCPSQASSYGIYCAMKEASIELTGRFQNQRPAMTLLRNLIDERTGGDRYSARMVDYNNLPTTTFSDVQNLFAEAIRRIDASQ